MLPLGNWNPRTHQALQKLIKRGAGKRLPVVFDFDNTLVSGDIGEATLAFLSRSKKLQPSRIPLTLSPAFRRPDGRKVNLRRCADVTEYYEDFLAPTAHGSRDSTALANGYVWAVECLDGLCLADVVEAAQEILALSNQNEPAFIEASPGGQCYPVPVFYPSMVELIGALIQNDFEIWIVSASNVWSVRWLVMHGLNPRLRALGVKKEVRPQNVVGVSSLLKDGKDRLYKDALLVREQPRYLRLETGALKRYKLTSRLQFPASTYAGKVACIWDAVGTRPFLAAGDSPGDLSMLSFSHHRLWLARLEKPDYQALALQRVRQEGGRDWLIQPVRSSGKPCFLPQLPQPAGRTGTSDKSATHSSAILRKLHLLIADPNQRQ